MEFAAEAGALEGVQEGASGGEFEDVATEDEVVAFGLDGEEGEAEGLGGGAGGEAAIGVAEVNAVGGSEVPRGEGIVAVDAMGFEAGGGEETIEETAAAGTGFAIDETDRLPREIGGRLQPLRVTWRGDPAGFPVREGDDHEVFAGKFLGEIGEVEVARFGIAEVGSGNVDLAFDHPAEGEFTGGGGGDDFDAGGALDHFGEPAKGGVAAGDDEAFGPGVVFGEGGDGVCGAQ